MQPAVTRARSPRPPWFAVRWMMAFAVTAVFVASLAAQTAPAQKPTPDKPAAQPASPDKPATADKPAQSDAAKPKPRFSLDDTKPEPPEEQPAAKPKPRFTMDDTKPDPDDPQTKTQTKPGSRFGGVDEEDDTPKPPIDPNKLSTGGWRACIRCHEKQAAAYVEGPHAADWNERTPAARVGCEVCHGPGQSHSDYPGVKGLILNAAKMTPREASQMCLTCHNRGDHVLWQGSMHDARNVTCVNCHSVHHPKSEKAHLKQDSVVATCADCHRDKAAKMARSAHMPVREGKMDCASCHNEHGSTNVRLLRAGNTVNESCTSCHAEKRGPFLWDHAPARENCTTCHEPHGSSNDRMIVSNTTMLCQKCHVGTRHPATPYDGIALVNRSNRLIGRGCVNCHPMVHGSNHPSGQFLMR